MDDVWETDQSGVEPDGHHEDKEWANEGLVSWFSEDSGDANEDVSDVVDDGDNWAHMVLVGHVDASDETNCNHMVQSHLDEVLVRGGAEMVNKRTQMEAQYHEEVLL